MNVDAKITVLVEEFSEVAKRHQASSLTNWRIANNEANKIQKVFSEIISYGQPGRDALLDLTDSEELIVSLFAAVYSLKHNTVKSLDALRILTKQPGFIGFQAQQAINRWEEGSWHLE